MKARSVAITALVVAWLTGCATTAAEEGEPTGNFAFSLLMGITQIAVEAAFDAAFSSEEKEDHRGQPWAASGHSRHTHTRRRPETKSAPVAFKVTDKDKGVGR